VPVIAGAGSPSTHHAIELARQAEAMGADGLLAVTPYYNRPPQDGLYQHFRALNDATGLPILLYDVPARTGCTLAVDTIARLAELPRIAGLKDAGRDLDRVSALRRLVGGEFRLLSGDDATVLAFLLLGGHGCVSVACNLAPELCTRLYDAWERGDLLEAQRMARTLAPLAAALTSESNPGPLKYALSEMGVMREEVRLPLCPPSKSSRAKIQDALSLVRGARQSRNHAAVP
jgi:4-hydroxy-tetrahydrodipicolinate synthase